MAENVLVFRHTTDPVLPFGIPEHLLEEDGHVTAEAATPILERGRRADVEQELTEKYHVKWRYRENVPLSEFDLEKSLHNQARFDPIDKATVEQYAEAVKRGDAFPAVIAYKPTARGRLLIIDGNHRLNGHTAAEAEGIDLYEVDRNTDPRTIAAMTYAFNTRHGRPTSEEERVAQAIYLIDNGASAESAAAEVSLPMRILKKALAKQKADQRADECGVKRNEWDALGQTIKNRLLNISTDEGFVDAVPLAFAAKLDANEVFELVSQLNATRSGTKQRAIVKAWRQAHQDRIQGNAGGVLGTADRRKMSPKTRLGLSLSHLLSMPDNYGEIVKSYAPPERKDAAKNIREAATRLTRLADELDKKK